MALFLVLLQKHIEITNSGNKGLMLRGVSIRVKLPHREFHQKYVTIHQIIKSVNLLERSVSKKSSVKSSFDQKTSSVTSEIFKIDKKLGII